MFMRMCMYFSTCKDRGQHQVSCQSFCTLCFYRPSLCCTDSSRITGQHTPVLRLQKCATISDFLCGSEGLN